MLSIWKSIINIQNDVLTCTEAHLSSLHNRTNYLNHLTRGGLRGWLVLRNCSTLLEGPHLVSRLLRFVEGPPEFLWGVVFVLLVAQVPVAVCPWLVSGAHCGFLGLPWSSRYHAPGGPMFRSACHAWAITWLGCTGCCCSDFHYSSVSLAGIPWHSLGSQLTESSGSFHLTPPLLLCISWGLKNAAPVQGTFSSKVL